MSRGPARPNTALSALTALSLCLAAAAILPGPLPARAGEVRMNVASNFFVDPILSGSHRYVNCNVGDHVVWVWVGTSHTCTSGDSATLGPDGHWDSGLQGVIGAAFSWQATGSGVFPFYCQPHAPAMAGRVIVASSGIAVSDLRLTEVLYNDAGALDKIEVTNIGSGTGDLGRYRFSVNTGTQVALAPNAILLPPNATVTIHVNEAGTNTATDVYAPTIGALNDAAGSVALYAANTANTVLTDATQMIDYVEWGTTGNPNEATALTASLWTSGASAPAVATDHSIEFCGTAAQHAGRWFDNPMPNFGGLADNCITPTRTSSWGRIKTLYR